MPVVDRSERLIALLLLEQMKDSPAHEKARRLSIAGFTNSEIADLLETNSAVIASTLYQARQKPKKKGKKKAKKKAKKKK